MTAAILTTALASLGDTPGQVAVSLHQLGLRGERLEGGKCPIARYVESLGFEVLGVIEDSVDVADPSDGSKVIEIDLPAAVSQFVHGFDEGAWPELVAVPEPAPTEPVLGAS